MRNKILENQFLNSIEDEEVKSLTKSVLEKIKPVEESYNKNIYDFSMTEATELLNELKKSEGNVEEFKQVLEDYSNCAIENAYTETRINAWHFI
jgi:hypothetical protein